MKYLYVKVDTNDADYLTELTKISEEDLARFMPLIQAIKNFKPYQTKYTSTACRTPEERTIIHENNWPCSEDLPRKDLGEQSPEDIYSEEVYGSIDPETIKWFGDDYVPFGSHTIEEISVLEITEYERLV